MNKIPLLAIFLFLSACGDENLFCETADEPETFPLEVSFNNDGVAVLSWEGANAGMVRIFDPNAGEDDTIPFGMDCAPIEGADTRTDAPQQGCIESPWTYGSMPDAEHTMFAENQATLTAGTTYEARVYRDVKEGDCYMGTISETTEFVAE